MADSSNRIEMLERRMCQGGTVVAEVESCLDAIRRTQPVLNAFVAVHSRRACEVARQRDERLRNGQPRAPLEGVAVAIKDNMDEADVVSAAGCRAYRDRIPDRDAACVESLRLAGAVIVGRTNMHELADGVTSDNPHHGPVHNPYRPGVSPGGSSGGAAAAVAAGCVPVALGTDTGGSIRIPAALCGVVGLKPTTGLVSTEGVMPLSRELDCVGPLAGSVAEVALALRVLAPKQVRLGSAAGDATTGLRVGLLTGFFAQSEASVAALVEAAARAGERLGWRFSALKLPELDDALRLLSRIYAPEAAAFHAARLAERPEDFGQAVRDDLRRGLAADPARRRQALVERQDLRAAVDRAGSELDLLLCPTTPLTARPHDLPDAHRYLLFTCPFNLTGQPALSLPVGLHDGLPVGLQLVARRGEDERLLAAAAALERELGLRLQPPTA